MGLGPMQLTKTTKVKSELTESTDHLSDQNYYDSSEVSNAGYRSRSQSPYQFNLDSLKIIS